MDAIQDLQPNERIFGVRYTGNGVRSAIILCGRVVNPDDRGQVDLNVDLVLYPRGDRVEQSGSIGGYCNRWRVLPHHCRRTLSEAVELIAAEHARQSEQFQQQISRTQAFLTQDASDLSVLETFAATEGNHLVEGYAPAS